MTPPVEEDGIGVAVAEVDSGVPQGGGVEMILTGAGASDLDSAVAEGGGGVVAVVDAWPEQAAKTMIIGAIAQVRYLVIRVLLSL